MSTRDVLDRCRFRRFGHAMCVSAALACARPGPPLPDSGAQGPPRPECPTHKLALVVSDSSDGARVPRIVTNIPIAPSIDEVPEYHDCQRLVRVSEPHYGPLVGIFAAEGIDTLFGTFDAKGNPADLEAARAGRAAAQIFNFDSESYGPLAIQREFSCLYLARDASGWRAYMVWAGSDETRCTKPLAFRGPLPPHELDVFAEDPTRYDGGPLLAEDIPPVARWQFDDRGRHAIGIKCGTQWCTVVARGSHPESVTPLPAAAAFAANALSAGGAGRKDRRVVQVKGWYDDQFLALSDPASPVGLAPRGPRVRLYPHPSLADWNDPADFSEWRTVAFASIVQGGAGKYADTLNLGSGITSYDLLHRDPGALAPADVGALACAPSGNGTWFMRLTQGASVKYGCVTQRDHPEASKLPGTVRWRWKIDDETMWVRCPGGCCTLER